MLGSLRARKEYVGALDPLRCETVGCDVNKILAKASKREFIGHGGTQNSTLSATAHVYTAFRNNFGLDGDRRDELRPGGTITARTFVWPYNQSVITL